MSSPGVEPGLSRPRRDVLTTRRCGQMPAGELFSHTHIFQTSDVVLGMIDKYMHLGDARVAYWIRRLPPKEEIAGSSLVSSIYTTLRTGVNGGAQGPNRLPHLVSERNRVHAGLLYDIVVWGC